MADNQFKRSGGQANLTIDGVLIPITSYTISYNGNYEEATDSADWSPAHNRLARSSMPGVLEIEIEVEFYFRSNLTQTNIIDKLKGNEPVALILSLQDDANTVLEEGTFWPSEGEIEGDASSSEPISGSVTFINEGLPD